MGRGRKPLAAEVKDASGAYRKNPQRRNKSAPIADGTRPEMPKWFKAREKEKWNELCELLEGNRVMSKDTVEIMVAYCTAYGSWRAARDKVAKTGLAIEGVDKQGNVTITRNAYVTEMNKFRDQMNKLLPEFGLTPASRQKLVAAKPEQEESAFSALLERMQGRN